mgnify:CR=1 FL=1
MISPFLEVDLEKIRRNTEQVVSLCRSHNIEVLGVTMEARQLVRVSHWPRGGTQDRKLLGDRLVAAAAPSLQPLPPAAACIRQTSGSTQDWPAAT